MKARLLLFLLLSAILCGQQTLIGTLADITGDGSAHKISSTPIAARWIQIVAITGNSAVVRIGDSNVGSSRGTPVAAGGGFMMPPPNSSFPSYDLSQVYYYAANGDKLSVTWGKP